jgi:hypothetical protein
MGKKSKRNGSGRRGADHTEVVKTTLVYSPTAAVASGENVFSIACGINPLVGVTVGGAKLAAMADLFQYYRFRRFSARIISANTQANPAAYSLVRTVMGAEAYGSSLPGTEADVLQMAECSEAAMVKSGTTTSIFAQMPSVTRWFHVSKRLLGDQQVKWYRTVPGSFDDALEYQFLFAVSALSDVASYTVRPHIQIRVEVEFRSFTSANLTPLKSLVQSQKEDEKSCDADSESSDTESSGLDLGLVADESKIIEDPAHFTTFGAPSAYIRGFKHKVLQQAKELSATMNISVQEAKRQLGLK